MSDWSSDVCSADLAEAAPSLHLPGRNEYKATVGDVLSHRRGLYRNAFDNKLEEGQDVTFLRGTLATLNSICPPGSCWSYQNVAYDAASEMVSRVSGMRYQETVERDLFARSEERRVGKACVSTCRSRGSPYH